jgi:hypothetical protein
MPVGSVGPGTTRTTYRDHMTDAFVPTDFDVPVSFDGTGFRLEPLGAAHNERDHEAWMSSIEHIHATPGFDGPDADWPAPMSLEGNLSDLVRHADDFAARTGFTYRSSTETKSSGASTSTRHRIQHMMRMCGRGSG